MLNLSFFFRLHTKLSKENVCDFVLCEDDENPIIPGIVRYTGTTLFVQTNRVFELVFFSIHLRKKKYREKDPDPLNNEHPVHPILVTRFISGPNRVGTILTTTFSYTGDDVTVGSRVGDTG